jgi:hypothetical protein
MSIPFRTLPAAALAAVALSAPGLEAQAERAEILHPVEELFAAMEHRDPARAAAVLLPEGQFVVVRLNGDGRATTSITTHESFLARLGEGDEPWFERYWNPEIQVHGPIAVVWTPYDFSRGERFSHCGVDAFNLVRTDEGWKIAATVYTVEPTGCPLEVR